MCQQPGRLYGLYGSACRIKTREDELLQQYVCKQRAGAKLGQAVAVLLWHSGFGSTGNVIFLPHVVSVLSVDLSLTFFPTSQATYWKSFLPILLSCHFAGTTLKKPAAARRRGAAARRGQSSGDQQMEDNFHLERLPLFSWDVKQIELFEDDR